MYQRDPESIAVGYHSLDDPLNPSPLQPGYSPLHLLYPGRPMNITDYYDRDEIPAENPELAQKAYQTRKKEIKTYAKGLENLARLEGGGDANKVDFHPVVDPDDPVNDVALQFVDEKLPPVNKIKNFKEPPTIPPTFTEENREGFENKTKKKHKKFRRDQDLSLWWILFAIVLLIIVCAFATWLLATK